MARPNKNNCDYFPHDNGMRNHAKVKAIRNKFENGYSVWVMLLEFLTGSDGNVFEYSEIQFELLSGDFGFSVTEIKDIVDYAVKLEMLFVHDGFVNSDSLDERLKPVYEKRGKSKEQSAKQKRLNGKYVSESTVDTVVSVTEMPQSKVKESKVKKSKKNKLVPTTVDDVIDSVKHLFDSKYMNTSSKETIAFLLKTYTKQDIIDAIVWAKKDDFWSTIFLSLNKLNKPDKQGVKFIDVFIAKMQKTKPATAQAAGYKSTLRPEDYEY